MLIKHKYKIYILIEIDSIYLSVGLRRSVLVHCNLNTLEDTNNR